MSNSSAALDTVGDVAQVLGDAIAAPLELGAELLDDVGPDLVDLADAAAATAVASSRLGFRLLAATFSFVGRHPKKALAFVVVVAVIGAVSSYVCANSGNGTSDDG